MACFVFERCSAILLLLLLLLLLRSPFLVARLCSVRGCLHDTGMTFIPERVHSVSIYSSVSVHMIPRRNFVPVQVIPE